MFLTVSDLIRLYDGVRSASWCYDLYRTIKAAYGLNRKGQMLTIRQYCDYNQLDINEVYTLLNAPVVSTKKAA